jgi:N-acetylneuraminic acid mutarotase
MKDNWYLVYCYDTSQDKWTTLPPLPVKYFGVGHIDGKLVAVGGVRKKDGRETGVVFSFQVSAAEQAQKWKQTIPPMPTARHSPSILSLQSALVVAGGFSLLSARYVNTVEIFKSDTSQWHSADPLPVECLDVSLVAIGNTCYALGGYNNSQLNQALYASVDDLLGNAVPANQTTHSGSSDTRSAWKTLPNTPTYDPTSATLAGNLLAIGGNETPGRGAATKEIYMYSPSTNSWIYVSDLPAPRSDSIVAILSPTEVLVIGGWKDGDIVNTTYKGTLRFDL